MKKKLLSLTMLVAITGLISACGQNSQTNAPVEQSNNATAQSWAGRADFSTYLAKELFDGKDLDKDGFLNATEIGSNDTLVRLDRNADKKVSLDEFTKGEYLAISDLNKDKTENSKDAFNKIDSNKDKRVTKQELLAFYDGAEDYNTLREKISIFYLSDKNHDNLLTSGEFEDMFFSFYKATQEAKQLTSK